MKTFVTESPLRDEVMAMTKGIIPKIIPGIFCGEIFHLFHKGLYSSRNPSTLTRDSNANKEYWLRSTEPMTIKTNKAPNKARFQKLLTVDFMLYNNS